MADAASSKSNALKAAEAERQAQQLESKRAQQLKDYENVVRSLRKQLHATKINSRKSRELLDHSGGFYEEINKLAKGKNVFPATQLVRETANDIIRDAKSLISETADVHLKRIKEFIFAGDEPTYPEILITIRAVNDSLRRHVGRNDDHMEGLEEKLKLASTAVGALTYVLKDEDADEDSKQTPPKELVAEYTKGPICGIAFTLIDGSYNEYYFDFDKLDSLTPDEYVSMSEADDDGVEDDLSSEDEQSENGEEDNSEDE